MSQTNFDSIFEEQLQRIMLVTGKRTLTALAVILHPAFQILCNGLQGLQTALHNLPAYRPQNRFIRQARMLLFFSAISF